MALLILILIFCLYVGNSFALVNSFGGLRIAHVHSKISLGTLSMAIKVECNSGEAIEDIMKKFKRACNQSGHLMELKVKEQWETAAEKKKRKRTRSKLLNRIERTNDRYERRSFGGTEYNS